MQRMSKTRAILLAGLLISGLVAPARGASGGDETFQKATAALQLAWKDAMDAWTDLEAVRQVVLLEIQRFDEEKRACNERFAALTQEGEALMAPMKALVEEARKLKEEGRDRPATVEELQAVAASEEKVRENIREMKELRRQCEERFETIARRVEKGMAVFEAAHARSEAAASSYERLQTALSAASEGKRSSDAGRSLFDLITLLGRIVGMASAAAKGDPAGGLAFLGASPPPRSSAPGITAPAPPPCLPTMGQSGDPEPGGSRYTWFRECGGTVRVHGHNISTGSVWRAALKPNGDQEGWSSNIGSWRYDALTGNYSAEGGHGCSGKGTMRRCW